MNTIVRTRLIILILFYFMAPLSASQAEIERVDWERFLDLAETALETGNREDAEYNIYRARDLAWKVESSEGLVRAGFGFAMLQNIDEAKTSWLVARDIAWRENDPKGLIKAGQGLIALGAWEEAETAVRNGVAIASKLGDWEDIVRAGHTYVALKNYKTAYEMGRRAYALAKERSSSEGLFQAGQVFGMIQAYEETLRSAETLKKLAWSHEDWSGLIRAGQIFTMLGEVDQTYDSAYGARELAAKRESWDGVFQAGLLVQQLGDQKGAELFFTEAKKLSESQGFSVRGAGTQPESPTNTLLVRNMKGIAPSLAESWFMSDDNGFVTVRIRNDIKCPGGGNLNAKDVVRSFKTNRGTWGRASIYWVQSVGPLELRISPGPMVFMLAHPYTAIRCRSKEEIEKEKEEGVPGGG